MGSPHQGPGEKNGENPGCEYKIRNTFKESSLGLGYPFPKK
jgi:hypothetical protein